MGRLDELLGLISPPSDGLDTDITVDASRILRPRCLEELGTGSGSRETSGVVSDAVWPDAVLRHVASAISRAAGIERAFRTRSPHEPTDESFRQARAVRAQADTDGYVYVGGGSVIDNAKEANLMPATCRLLVVCQSSGSVLNAGPGTLKPHIECPTTSGTGSEVTGIAPLIAVMRPKKANSSHALRPTEALVDLTDRHTARPGSSRARDRSASSCIGIVINNTARPCPPSRPTRTALGR